MSKTRLFTTVSIYSFHMLKSSTAQIEKIIELAKQKEEDVHPLSGKARALLELAAAIPDTRNALIATWVASRPCFLNRWYLHDSRYGWSFNSTKEIVIG
jgi:hypothetical protein